jgi:DNA polymerase III epsilon subunit-like protein
MELIWDLEANGLLREADKVWCAAWTVNGGIQSVLTEDVDKLFGFINSSTKIIGHNIIGYDLPLLEKLYGFRPNKKVEVIDTLVWSRLFYPDLQSPEGWKGKPKPHSIEAWAMRLGEAPKIQQEQWDVYDPNMLERCVSDVKITEKLYQKLLKEYNG